MNNFEKIESSFMKKIMNNNLISIIIPCYNQGRFLNETILSVYNQTYSNWECIIINDGSTDDSEEIVNRWVVKDNRFKYFYKENAGVSSARNLGLEKVNGNYIQFLDSDDIILSTKISKSIEAIKAFDVQVVCVNYNQFVDSQSLMLGAFSNLEKYEFTFQNVARYWNAGFTIPIHCFLFKYDVIKDYSFPIGITAQEDWAMWLQVYQENPKTYFLNEILALYRSNPKGRTSSGSIFNETLLAIDYLNTKLDSSHFKILYEAVIMRYDEGLHYWRKREDNLKKSNTFQFGWLCKKVLKKIGLLPVAKRIFQYLAPLNR